MALHSGLGSCLGDVRYFAFEPGSSPMEKVFPSIESGWFIYY